MPGSLAADRDDLTSVPDTHPTDVSDDPSRRSRLDPAHATGDTAVFCGHDLTL